MGYTRKKRNNDILKKFVLPKSFDLGNIIYKKPKKDDLAVCLVYFNGNKSKRILMNYLYVVEKLKISNIPYFTMEMYDDFPEISEAFHIKTDFILFQKERLCHLLEKHIPDKYSKLVFIDGDIVFDNVNWYNELSDKLNSFNVVQVFEKCIRLDITYTKIVNESLTYILRKKFGNVKFAPNTRMGFSPGGAWGFQRPWFKKVGFFDGDVLGGSDTYSVLSWGITRDKYHYPSFLERSIKEYKGLIDTVPSTDYLNTNIYHLWHGSQKNKQYGTRVNIFKGVQDIKDVITTDRNGLYKLKNKTIKKRFNKYFTRREDDGI
jgi:hypothetical protein